MQEAVADLKKASRKNPTLAAAGAVRFLEKLSPALEHVDSSSGAVGTAVTHAMAALGPLIARAREDVATRDS